MDAGATWGRFRSRGLISTTEDGLIGRDFANLRPVFSAGFSARVNLLGALIFEPYYAFPFSRDDETAVFGLSLTAGW